MMLPFLLLKENFISENFCEYCIEFFNLNYHLHYPGIAGDVADSRYLTDTELRLSFSETSNPIVLKLLSYLTEVIEEYKKINPCLNVIDSWKVHDTFQIQKYEPGECYFGEHCEHGSSSHGNNISNRIISWTIYLNDVNDGGGTEFTQYDYIIQPRQGNLVLFPAGWTHMHRGVISPTEEKYIMTGWYCYDHR